MTEPRYDTATGFLQRLWRDRKGAAAVFIAVGLIPMIGAIGLAVDSSLGYLLKSRLSKSLDTAGLAAGRVALQDNAADIARQYFDANFANTSGTITLTDFQFELDDTRQFVTISAQATAPTFFMRIFGQDEMTVASRARIERQTTGMELALVLDNTGSMWGAKYTAMLAAAYDLVDIIYGDETEVENLWVSLVPYTATINMGPGRTGWLAGGDRAVSSPGDFSTDGWRGCVMARTGGRDQDDAPPSEAAFASYFYAATARTQDNNWPPMRTSIADENGGSSSDRNQARGPNLGCASPITPLTASRTTIEAGLAAMGPIHRGGTAGNLGLSWGWRVLSPRWRGLWGGATPADMPLDYGTPLMEKVVVILTDGNNQFHDQDTGGGTPKSDFTAYGRLDDMGVADLAAGRAVLDGRMGTTCGLMKDEGIRIYSITFGASPDATAQNLFRACATSPSMYFHAPDETALAQAFKAIGGELANLRIVE